MRFKYYLYYKNKYFHFYNRKTKKDNTFVSFYSVYCYIKEHKIDFNNVRIKAMSLYELFRDYCKFDDYRERI